MKQTIKTVEKIGEKTVVMEGQEMIISLHKAILQSGQIRFIPKVRLDRTEQIRLEKKRKLEIRIKQLNEKLKSL